MRRIDLLCKLFGPLFIATMDGQSSRVAILVNFGMNVASLPVEYLAIARVYHEVPELQAPKTRPQRSTAPQQESPHATESTISNAWKSLVEMVRQSGRDFALYFKHRAFLPSMAGAILYLTVLSFGGQMVTYLLSSGYSSVQIGIARTFGVIFEVLSTWAAPWLMGRIGAVRAGLWMSSWQVMMLAAGVCVFWIFEGENSIVSASGLVGGTVLSRLGLRGFDLCVQLIIQEVSEAMPSVLQSSRIYAKHLVRRLVSIITDIAIRKSKPNTAAFSLPSRRPSRTALSSWRMRPPLPFPGQTSSSGRRSSRLWLLHRPVAPMRCLCTCAGGICCTLGP